MEFLIIKPIEISALRIRQAFTFGGNWTYWWNTTELRRKKASEDSRELSNVSVFLFRN